MLLQERTLAYHFLKSLIECVTATRDNILHVIHQKSSLFLHTSSTVDRSYTFVNTAYICRLPPPPCGVYQSSPHRVLHDTTERSPQAVGGADLQGRPRIGIRHSHHEAGAVSSAGMKINIHSGTGTRIGCWKNGYGEFQFAD